MLNKHNRKTRDIFHKIHKDINKNKTSYKKLSTLFNFNNLNLDKNYFKNKVCADFGCGSTGVGAMNLFNLGATNIFLVDMDKHIVPELKKKLRKYKDKFKIKISSIERTKFKKNFFDFILCQGVIHHAKNDKKCFKEIYRVLKPGGYFVTQVHGSNGLMTKFVMDILRPEYNQNKLTKKILDDLMFNNFRKYKNFYYSNINDETKKIVKFLINYIDQDLLLTIQDRILSPKYKTYELNHLTKSLKKIGFVNIKRIKKEVKFKNIRRLLEPFYLHQNHELSKLLYGDGSLTLIMRKK